MSWAMSSSAVCSAGCNRAPSGVEPRTNPQPQTYPGGGSLSIGVQAEARVPLAHDRDGGEVHRAGSVRRAVPPGGPVRV